MTNLEKLLSTDEVDRANQFAQKHLRESYVIARACLRKILSAWVHTDAKEIQFSYSPFGKPYIAHPTEHPIQFNLSHSRDLIAIAVSTASPVGIDIEFCCSELEVTELAEQLMTSQELRTFASIGCTDCTPHPPEPSTQRKLFFSLFTIKESFLKATGKGFSLDPRSIEVDCEQRSFLLSCPKQQPITGETELSDMNHSGDITTMIHDIHPQDWYFSHYEFKSNNSFYSLAISSPQMHMEECFHMHLPNFSI
jgi:phosphopantetheinyl transferase